MTELEKRISLLEKTKTHLINKLDDLPDKVENVSPNLLIFIRDPFRHTGHWINGLSRTLFYLLIISSIILSGIFFFIEYSKLMFNDTSDSYAEKFVNEIKLDSLNFNQDQIKYLESKIKIASHNIVKLKSNSKDLNVLTFIEHIFIYLLPLLIFIGLYFYFESNYKYRLLGNKDKNDDEIKHSQNALDLTKTLFISSILAYSIIKIIEKVILAEPENMPDIITLISYGVFLVLLMGYLLFSHKLSHAKHQS